MLKRSISWSLKSQQLHPDFKITSNIYKHSLGSTLIHLDSKDSHKAFAVLFRTTPQNDTGVAHCLEHIALCGSQQFPVRDPFMKMLSRSLNSYMNAWTGSDFTMYPFSTKNSKDFYNLLSVYLDASYFPLLNYEDFLQEAWRLAWEDGKLTYKGVVFNEMKGRASDPVDVLLMRLSKELMPGTTYQYNSGGDPLSIPKLTFDDLKEFHSNFYHPSNSTFLLYGDVDINKVQQEIDQKVLKHFSQNSANTQVPIAGSIKKPDILKIQVPADPVQTDPERPCKYAIGFLCDPIEAEPFVTFALSVLSSALFNSQDSPMYKSLLESRLGSKYLSGTGFDFSSRQGVFLIGLNGVGTGKEAEIEETIWKTLKKVSEDGFEGDLIESALHQIEIRNKEVKENFGLGLISHMIPFALHGSDPLIPLYINSYVKMLRKMLAEKKPVFQDLIKKYLLNNDHYVRIMTVPEEGYIEKLELAEENELKNIEKGLDKEARKKIEQESEALLKAQSKLEDCNVLPTLTVDDIEKNAEFVEYESSVMIQGVKVNYIIQPTNGITYIRVKCDISDLPLALRPYLSIYKRLVNSIGTKLNPYNTFDTLKDLYTTSGISSSIFTSSSPDSISHHHEYFTMKISCLDRNLLKAFNIFQEFLTQLTFTESSHIQNLIKRSVKSRTDDLLDSGSSYGSSYASASLTPSAASYESLSSLQFDCQLVSKLDSSLPDLQLKLEEIHSFITQKQSFEFLIHSSEVSNKDLINSQIYQILSSLNTSQRAKLSNQFQSKYIRNFFYLPVQVNYVVQAMLGTHYTHPDYPALKLLCEIMSMKSLLKEVREKGGAYGASASVDCWRGSIVLSSFRDPENSSTYTAFEKSANDMSDGRFSQVDIDEGKLGVFSRIDKPVAIYDKGLHRYLFNLTVEQMQNYRTRLLGLEKDDLVRVAQSYLKQPSSKVIFGPEGTKLDSDEWKYSSPIIN